MNNFFPYDELRTPQKEMIDAIEESFQQKKILFVHAPTGIGKTIASLVPSLFHALHNKKTLFFLTSRQTQHEIALQTIKEMRKKSGENILVADLIGKKGMCLQPNVSLLTSHEFHSFCQTLVEENACEYYQQTRENGKTTSKAKTVLDNVRDQGVIDSSSLLALSSTYHVCPYEISLLTAERAQIIIADYNYLFHPAIRTIFLQKIKKGLSDCMVIIDEGHNLPRRCRDLLTVKLTSGMIERAYTEAEKFSSELCPKIVILRTIFEKLSLKIPEGSEECLISKKEFMTFVGSLIGEYDAFATTLVEIGKEIRREQQYSSLGSMGEFLNIWKGPDEGFVRVFSTSSPKQGLFFSLTYRSLDPSPLIKDVIDHVHSAVVMSGTLTPLSFFREVYGCEGALERELQSPFPASRRLNLIVSGVTTKFSRRGEEEFHRIALICSQLITSIPGNSAIFFPSYFLRDKVWSYLSQMSAKPLLKEIQGADRKYKLALLEKFKMNKTEGSVLLGVSTGSFGEGIDLPGDLLNGVIIVGLPLEKPNAETVECMRYYQEKYGKGWEYGYIYPAMIKCMQNAGRCIRSETDKGVVVFLDERYADEKYFSCFPKDWDIKISNNFEEDVQVFFS